MPVSKLDQVYRSILLSKFFTKGWGKPDNIKRLFEFRKVIRCRETCFPLVPSNYPIHIDKEDVQTDCRILEGHFMSPFPQYLPGVVPKESETAYFQMVLPKQWKTHLRPIILHLAGTGDHFFWRRRALMARPLLKETGIASIILENPFYGMRKPRDQVRSSLHNVSDIFVMGGCLALESIALFNWCEREGFGPLGVTGVSMGGHMASIAAGVWPKPLVLVPCLSWTTASCVFTQGVMSGAIPWHILENQYFSDGVYHDELRKMLSSLVDDDAFEAGKHFAKTYPDSLERLKDINTGETDDATGRDKVAAPKDVVTPITSSATIPAMDTLNFSNLSSSAEVVQRSTNPLPKSQVKPRMAAVTSKLGLKNAILRSRSKGNPSHQQEALQFMRGIMDEFTHLANFSSPLDPNLIIVVAAKDDAYVLREGILDLTELWPGSEVRFIDSGHIAAFLFSQSIFRKAIADAYGRMYEKHYTDVPTKVEAPVSNRVLKYAQDIQS